MAKQEKENKYFNDLLKEKDNLEIEIEELTNNINALQDGENGNPYWNGKNAKEVLKELIKHVDSCNEVLDSVKDVVSFLKTN